MTEAEWQSATNPYPLLEFLRGTASERKARLFAVACCGRAKPYCEHVYFELADVAEAFADGLASLQQLQETQARHIRSNDYPDRAAFYDTAAADLWENLPYLVGDLAHRVADCTTNTDGMNWDQSQDATWQAVLREETLVAEALRDIFGNPFRPVRFSPQWRTSTVVALATQMYESRDFSAMPILADALQDAGCDDEELLGHCRGTVPHVRGCWALDLVLGRE